MSEINQLFLGKDYGDCVQQAPLVSVIMPAYNAEPYVLEAVRSVLDQDYEPVEILLIDDGSTDGTVELVQSEAPQVKIIQQANAGVAAARNTGLRRARGELICFLDADDGWLPGKLTAQVNYLQQHPEVGLVFHDFLVWKPDETGVYFPLEITIPFQIEIDPHLSGWIYPQLLLNCVVHTSTVMMRRQVFYDVSFFETTLISGEDYHYWLRVSRKYQIHKLIAVYSYYRVVANSLTNKDPKSDNYEYHVIRSAIDQWGLSSPDNSSSISKTLANRRLAKLAFNYGYRHFHYGSAQLARKAFLRALQHKPLQWRAIIYLIASLFR